mmetsp:Transcript_43349/g.120539  ORF Transcript_43349/g.120539 Transcript_43349/m.120539 type:complete len:203 (+) Transcript_43349:71-679(+)
MGRLWRSSPLLQMWPRRSTTRRLRRGVPPLRLRIRWPRGAQPRRLLSGLLRRSLPPWRHLRASSPTSWRRLLRPTASRLGSTRCWPRSRRPRRGTLTTERLRRASRSRVAAPHPPRPRSSAPDTPTPSWPGSCSDGDARRRGRVAPRAGPKAHEFVRCSSSALLQALLRLYPAVVPGKPKALPPGRSAISPPSIGGDPLAGG